MLGSLAAYSLNSAVTDIKGNLKADKSKKERELSTAVVKKTLESREVYLSASKIIPEMGISEAKQAIYEPIKEE